jgi:hypothetical protein
MSIWEDLVQENIVRAESYEIRREILRELVNDHEAFIRGGVGLGRVSSNKRTSFSFFGALVSSEEPLICLDKRGFAPPGAPGPKSRKTFHQEGYQEEQFTSSPTKKCILLHHDIAGMLCILYLRCLCLSLVQYSISYEIL